MSRRVIVAGATGFIGRRLCRELLTHGYDVVVLTRSAELARGGFKDKKLAFVEWSGGLAEHFEGAYAVINLAGENVGQGRWTKEKKKRILDSRISAIETIVKAVGEVENGPEVLIQASAMGYYGDRGDQVLNEMAGLGSEFLSDVIGKCEDAAKSVEKHGVRLALIRTSLVLGLSGGALPRMMQPFKFYLGGVVGRGNEWISWIHIDDEVKAIRFLIERGDLSGPFNLATPAPVTSREFATILGNVMHKPSWFITPGFVLKLMMGDKAQELLLSSKRLEPDRLLKSGFSFNFPVLETALENIILDPRF